MPNYDDYDLDLEYVSAASPSRADIALKGIQQARVVKQLWIFLTAVIGLLTVINHSRRLFVRFGRRHRSVHSQTSDEKDITIEDARPGATGKTSLRRLPAAAASAFRVVMFRKTIPLGPGGIISITETTFIVMYIVALLVWLFVDSAYSSTSSGR
jgi:hypothetical protein